MPHLEFVIAGDGPLRKRVVHASEQLSNLSYVGWLARKDLLERIDACDALVMPSTLESFGNIALEAMARARIAVVTDTCGIVNWPEVSEHLVQFPLQKPLAVVLAALSEEPAQALKKRAQQAGEAARDLNQSSLEHWVELLQRAAA